MKLVLLIFLVLCVACARAAEPITFSRDIAPVLVAKCLACHNSEKAKGGYRLHTFEALAKPGSSKEAPIVSGKPEASLLYKLITAKDEDDRMPQKDDPLRPELIATIKHWIEQGAKFDGTNAAIALNILAPPRHPAAPKTYPVAIPVTALAFEPSGERLAASGYHEMTLWRSQSGELAQRIGNIAERVFDLSFSPDGQWLACAAGTPGKIGEVKLFNATNGEWQATLSTTVDAALCVAFSPDGKKLAAGGADNTIRIWDIPSGKLALTIEQHADWILGLAFNSDGTHLASASRDKTARLFDSVTGELDETYNGHSEFVTGVAWPDAKSVITASRNKSAHRWNIKDSKKIAEFSGWDSDVTRVLVSDTNLYSASLDGRVRMHSLGTKELTRTFEPHRDAVHSLASHKPTQRLASGSHDGEVRICSTADGKLLLKFIAAPGYASKVSRTE